MQCYSADLSAADTEIQKEAARWTQKCRKYNKDYEPWKSYLTITSSAHIIDTADVLSQAWFAKLNKNLKARG